MYTYIHTYIHNVYRPAVKKKINQKGKSLHASHDEKTLEKIIRPMNTRAMECTTLSLFLGSAITRKLLQNDPIMYYL